MGLGFSKSQNHEIPIASPDSSPQLTYKQPRNSQLIPSLKHTQSSQIGSVLGKPYIDINQMYEMKEELGKGKFGVTYRCIEKATGQEYACKSIAREKLMNRENIDGVRREVMILQHLSGRSNIVEFKGAYEDKQNVHLVMELCSGGELFDRIIAKGYYLEREAAKVMRQILKAIQVCHCLGIMHRDLRLENLLFSTKDQNATLKAIDFGSSVFIEKGKVYREIVGSAYYMAPEVLKRDYEKEIDVWSAGVILYILLSGVPPFSTGK